MPVKLGGAGGELNPQELLAFQEPAPRTVAAHKQKGCLAGTLFGLVRIEG